MIRTFAVAAFTAWLGLGPGLGLGGAQAQDWPSRVVKIMVPFGPGSTPDSAARIVADRLQAKLGQPFVIENKAGAGGNLATDAVAKSDPDGYTIGVSIVGPLALNSILFPRLPYDPAKDLAFVTIVASQPSVLVVNVDLPVKSVADLLALLKRDPGKYNFGSIGVGSLSHLAMEAIATASGTRPVHIPFPGSPAAVTALIRGDVQMAVLPAGSVVPQAEDGKLRMIAVTVPERSALLPNLPTLKEAGIEGVEADAWIGLVAPVRTSEAVLGKLGDAVREVLGEPEVRAKLKAQYMEPGGVSSERFRAIVQAELDRWGPVIRRNNIRMGQ